MNEKVPNPQALKRLASLDAFRGFVILTMVFVNYLPGMGDIPNWLLHAPQDADTHTLTDVVFPGFLFIVGVAIPLAMEKRITLGEPTFKLVWHVLVRSSALIFLGVVLVNSAWYSGDDALMSQDLWYLLFYAAVVLLWNRYDPTANPKVRRTLTFSCIVLLGLLFTLYRGRTPEGDLVWLHPQWWGILGIIGWSYLSASLLYLVFRSRRVILMGILGIQIALYIADRSGLFASLFPLNQYFSIGELLGTHPAIVMAGILVGSLFAGPDSTRDERERSYFMILFGAGLFLAGQLLRPLHGISKIGGTESYALVTAGECCLLFFGIYLLMDVLGYRRWAGFIQPIGRNPLLAYILPAILGSLMALTGTWEIFWPFWQAGGLLGILNAVAMTGLVLLVTWGFTRKQIILQL